MWQKISKLFCFVYRQSGLVLLSNLSKHDVMKRVEVKSEEMFNLHDFFFMFIPQNNWKFRKRTQFLLAKSETKFFWKKMIWLFSYMCTVHKLFGYDLYWIMVLVYQIGMIIYNFFKSLSKWKRYVNILEQYVLWSNVWIEDAARINLIIPVTLIIPSLW